MVVIDGRVIAAVGDVVQHDSSNSPLVSDYNQKYIPTKSIWFRKWHTHTPWNWMSHSITNRPLTRADAEMILFLAARICLSQQLSSSVYALLDERQWTRDVNKIRCASLSTVEVQKRRPAFGCGTMRVRTIQLPKTALSQKLAGLFFIIIIIYFLMRRPFLTAWVSHKSAALLRDRSSFSIAPQHEDAMKTTHNI